MNGKPLVKQLPNGLRYIVAPVAGLQSATVFGLVEAGTRYETPHNNGISHFLEHMVFKGTRDFKTAHDLSAAVDAVGGYLNAYTSKEHTAFYTKAAVAHLDLAMKVVSQLIFHPTLPSKELEVERGVILEEIRMYEDQPQSKVYRSFLDLLYAPTTLGWDTLGTEEIIRNLKLENFNEYMNYLYVPQRMVVAIAGGIEAGTALEEQIATYFGQPGDTVTIPTQTFTFPQDKPAVKRLVKDTEQCHLVYGFKTFGRNNPDRYTLSVIATILGGGMSSRLFEEIREKRGLAYYVGSTQGVFHETGYVGMRAGTKLDQAHEAVAIAREEYSKLKAEIVPEDELTKAKESLKGNLLLELEDSADRAEFYGQDLILEGKIRSVTQVMKAVDGVTAQDVMRLAQNVFIPENENLAVIGPEKIVSKIELNVPLAVKPKAKGKRKRQAK